MIRRAQQQAITFTALDVSTGAVMTGLTFPAGEVQISKDAGARANVTNAVTELGMGVYTVTLTAAETDAIWLHFLVRKTGVRPIDVPGATSGHPSGAVVADAANTATTFKTALASAVTDFYKGLLVRFTTGALAGQVRKITAYNGATKFVTVDSALTSVPADTDKFLLVEI